MFIKFHGKIELKPTSQEAETWDGNFSRKRRSLLGVVGCLIIIENA